MVLSRLAKNIEDAFNFFLFSYLACSQNMAKFSCGLLPLWLQHRI
jgi:hypothetical protein